MIRTGLHGHNGPGVVGVSVMGGGAAAIAGDVDWSQWYDHFWQAKGRTYVQSLLDRIGVQNLVEGNGAIPHNVATGWGFVAAAAQWLDTGLVPVNDQSWSVIIQYDNVIAANGVAVGCGNPAPLRQIYVQPNRAFAPPGLGYGNQGALSVLPVLLSGNAGVGGAIAYRDGVPDGAIPLAGVGALPTIYIGAQHWAAVSIAFTTFDCIAVGIKKGPPLTALQVAAAAAEMALI